MVRKLLGRWRRVPWDRLAERAGALASRCRPAAVPALFSLGFLFVVLLVHRQVLSFLIRRHEFAVPRFEASLGPRWADRQARETVVVEMPGATLFDGEVVERVGRPVEASPWVSRVVSVERAFPDQIRVRVEYRRPHVAVRRGHGYVLVDRDGVRLPGVYVEPPACDRAPVVTGVASLPPAPGRAWNDPAVRLGMEMADFVHRVPLLGRLGIREVDVSNAGGRQDPRRSELALVTAGGCSLFWGRAPSAGAFGEPGAEEKLENLRHVLAAYPGLRGVRYVKLYFNGSRAVEVQDAHVQRPR